MAKKKARIFRWLLWVVLGFVGLLILLSSLFYLGREVIMQKALTAMNEQRPGELQMGNMNLVPFMHFPSVVIQLKDIRYFSDRTQDPDQLPFLSLDELFVSLNVVDLIRGELRVNQLRLVEGYAHYRIFEDSLSNLERALGIRLAQEGISADSAQDAGMSIDLKKIELDHVALRYEDRLQHHSASLNVKHLESRFKSVDELIEAGLMLDMDIQDLKVSSLELSNRRGIQLEGEVLVDQKRKHVEMRQGSVHWAGLELNTRGTFLYADSSHIDLEFQASNEGLEILNFIFLGVLDLDGLEQIGEGSIGLEGTVEGALNQEQLPEINLNGQARNMAFRLKDYGKEVQAISFDFEASSGRLPDFKDAWISLQGLKAEASEGWILGNIEARGWPSPVFDLQLQGDVDLSGLEQLIRNEHMHHMRGRLKMDALLEGRMDPESDRLFGDEARLELVLENVAFVMGKDSLSDLNGWIELDRNRVRSRDLELVFNQNRAQVDFQVKNALHYALGYQRDVHASLGLHSDVLRPGELLTDTALVRLLGEEVKGLDVELSAGITYAELTRFIKEGSIPSLELSIDGFGVDLDTYADLRGMNARISFNPDSIHVEHLEGKVGQSQLELSCLVENYQYLLDARPDSSCRLEFSLRSDLLRAKDFFHYRGKFLLPPTYEEEYLDDFVFRGKLDLPVETLLSDSGESNFSFDLDEADWRFRNYPLVFQDVRGQFEKRGDTLGIRAFEGHIGESDFTLSAQVANYRDTVRENLSGFVELESGLLDFDELLNVQPARGNENPGPGDSLEQKEAPRLDEISYPDFSFQARIDELRYNGQRLFGIQGKLRSSPSRIFYLDSLITSGESGGSILVDGQLNVSNPYFYTVSADLDLKQVNMDDLKIELQSGEESYFLNERFAGILNAHGLAEVYFTPDLKLDMALTTAMFKVQLLEGRLMNFTALEAVGKFLDNKDLNNVRFSKLDNNFTLVDSQILIPRMAIKSTIGNMILEGEQGLDGSYLYLLRLPTWLVKEAAISRITGDRKQEDEEEIRAMKMGKYMVLTPWSDGEESRVRLGDKREKYR